MSNESMNALYGNRGIDTSYEREIFTYRPDLHYTKEQLRHILRPEMQQSIERSRTFTIAQNLLEYDELIQEVEEMLRTIEARNQKDSMTTFQSLLQQKQVADILSFEKDHSSYDQTGDFELYALLFMMKDSMVIRRDFLDHRFRTQFTSETEMEKITEAELSSIDQWEQLEASILEGYKHLSQEEADHDMENTSYLAIEKLEQLEKQKRQQELLHTSLADTSYVHRNRYFLFLEIVEHAKLLVYEPQRLVDHNLKSLLMGLKDIEDLAIPKTYLILQFRKLREKHESVKGKRLTIDDSKESFASEKQYLYQQLEVKAQEPMKGWLYQQEEGHSRALDLFSQYMVDSMTETRTSYDAIHADMLNFYQSEADFYSQQIHYLKKKEEIRKFYSILEDLEDVKQIRPEWVEEYLKVNGYTV